MFRACAVKIKHNPIFYVYINEVYMQFKKLFLKVIIMNTERISIADICRVCLETSNKLYPLQGRVHNVEEDILNMIKYCTLLEVTVEDDLPCGVCIPCFKTIRIAYNFIQQFKESHRKLLENRMNINKSECNGESYTLAHNRHFEEDPVQECDNVEEIIIEYNKEDICDTVDVNMMEQECEKINVYSKDVSTEVHEGNKFEIIYNTAESSPTRLSEEPEGDVDRDISIKSEVEDDLSEESKLFQKRDIISFTCPVCGETFSKFEVGFVKHLLTHEDVKLKCDKCSLAMTLTIDLYVQHYRKAHRFQCDICNKSYGRRSGLYYHIKTHNNAKVYKCSYSDCTKSFLTRWCLTKHFHTHSESPKYICSKCGNEFKTYGTYKYHQKTHDGNRSYLCTECGQTFFQSIHLKYHMWKHTGIKMFQCDMCHRSYTSQTQLKKHKKKKTCAILPKTENKMCKQEPM